MQPTPDGPPAGRRVAYVVSRFPKLSETFILREMVALEAAGWDVDLYALLAGRGEGLHPAAVPWAARVRLLPMLSLGVVTANLAVLRRTPRQYADLWLAVLRGYAGTPRALVRALALLPASVSLAEQVRRSGIPQLHAHYATYPLLACWVVHRLHGTPYTVTVHAHDLFVGTPMLAEKLRDVSAVVAISEYNREFLAREVDAGLRGRTHVVHCGVDVARYGGGQPASSDDVLDVLCVASLQEYKGQAHLVEACRLLVERGVPVRCTLVGHGPDEAALRERIVHAGLAQVVKLSGPRTEEEVADLMRKADVYVQPSVVAADGQMEGIPVALMEALASRLPVVATRLSGVPELVREGDTGWLVPPADAAALAAALEQVAADPARAAERAAAGRALVEREFDLHLNVAQLSALLEQVSPRPAEGAAA